MDIVTIIYKKVVKVDKNYVYICLSHNELIKAYRFDVYSSANSKKYGAYFRM